MFKITYCGWDEMRLEPDLGSGDYISVNDSTKHCKGVYFKTKEDALKFVCKFILKTAFHRNDWIFEEEIHPIKDFKGYEDGYVLHIMTDQNHKWATEKMIEKWRKNGCGYELIDLLVNVVIKPIDKK